MRRKTQVLVIHGGDTFVNDKGYVRYLKTRKISLERKVRWAGDYLEKGLGRHFYTINPRMPLQDNAKYRDWKIVFERYVPLLGRNFILIGQSLGGIFLAKYLSENKLPTRAISTFIVCPPFDNTLPNEELAGGFSLKSSLSLIEKNTRNLHILFSKDDPVIPISHAEKYKQKLPHAHVVMYKSKNGHFQISTFPEIIKMIQEDVRISQR